MQPTASSVYDFWLAWYHVAGVSWHWADQKAKTNVERWKLGWL